MSSVYILRIRSLIMVFSCVILIAAISGCAGTGKRKNKQSYGGAIGCAEPVPAEVVPAS